MLLMNIVLSIELEECLMLRADNACAIDMHFTKETIYD